MSKATLLVSCPDRKGLVATLAQQLYGHGANILDSDQHSDLEAEMFFQRIHFDVEGLETDIAALANEIRPLADRFDMTWRLEVHDQPKRVALMVSKVDHCLYDLVLRHRSGELNCQLALVVSNHDDLRHVADQFDLPYHYLPVTKTTKARQEAEVLDLFASESIDLVVLARYMQILTPEFIARYPSRVINIHHSFLPAFIGGRPYHQAYRRGVKLIGATAHYATSDLDEGPIIEQDVVRGSHRDSVKDLIRKGRDLERGVLGRAVRWHLEDRILVYGNKTVVFD